MGHHPRHQHDRADARRLRAPAEPRADEPRPTAGGRCAHAPPRPRGPGARPRSRRVLARSVRAGLLAARHRVRGRVHRHLRVAARARGPRRVRGALRRRVRRPDRTVGPAAGRRRPDRPGPGVGGGPRRLPGVAAAPAGDAQRARGRAPVHRTQHPHDPPGVRARRCGRARTPGGFIEHNIRMTRQAYGLDRIVEREFPADETLDARALERNSATIKNIRLWDYRPLLRTFAQLQEIRTYYKFVDVDNDRYVVNGEYRQLMLSPRELSYQHLQSRIWINEHLTFTHGYGVVVGPVNRITAEGLPEFLVKDIPPQSTGGFPKVTRPQIYYGEVSNEYVLVKTKSQELDYPSGDQNVYQPYSGAGAIPPP